MDARRPRLRTGSRSPLAVLVAVALGVAGSIVVAPAAGAGTAPTVGIQPSSGDPGQVIQVQANFPSACSQGMAALANTGTGNYAALSGLFVPNAAGNGSTTLTVPANALAGAYEVTAGCMSPVGDESAPVPFTVTGPSASVTIDKSKGLAGSAIAVELTITPSDVCGLAAVALRSAPEQNNGSAIVDLDLSLTPPAGPGQPYKGTVNVPNLAAPGTIYYIDGGCVGPFVVSPYKTFLVTAQNFTQVPKWWEFLQFSYDAGTEGLLLLLASGPTYPFVPITTTTTTTTAPRSTPTVAPPPPTSTSSTTTTTCPRDGCRR